MYLLQNIILERQRLVDSRSLNSLAVNPVGNPLWAKPRLSLTYREAILGLYKPALRLTMMISALRPIRRQFTATA